MVAKTYILENLRSLEYAFGKNKRPKLALYYSKTAILELCGWIEVSMDEIIGQHGDRKLTLAANRKYVATEIVKRTYGFEYDQHFRAMIIRLVGIISCERLESTIPIAVSAPFRAQLSSLKVVRDRLAHTYVKGPAATVIIDAPSVTKGRFNDLHQGLLAYEAALKAL